MILSLIVAMDRNRLIGSEGGMPWHLPADLAHFKRLTFGKPVIMGRRTYESIGRPLPGRHNIVVTGNPDYRADPCTVVASLPDALRAAGQVAEAMIIGGGRLYAEALPRCDRLYLTRIDAALDGDTWFPQVDEDDWVATERSRRRADAANAYDMEFVTLERRL